MQVCVAEGQHTAASDCVKALNTDMIPVRIDDLDHVSFRAV